MKKILCTLLALVLLTGCTAAPGQTETAPPDAVLWDAKITLSDSDIGITGELDHGVTTANDIVYYEAGHDFTYGEGEESEAHTAEEAAEHIVVHISKPGTYLLTGKLSKGQIAVDLGEEAEDDPNAVVTLILDNVDITCTVAPAVIFYSVYECGDAENPTANVDTSAAGANVILAEGSVNNIVGSHVAKIYKEGTLELSEDGTEVLDAKKLHKYDGAFYSRMSMNIGGEGCLNINADNEGLDSELHLTINSGTISIASGNDGINTNEDGVSVTTVNGGLLTIHVTGSTGEGDGIDSNGWLVINGGTVLAEACATSGDAGIDSDMGIHINGGTVCASGNMLDRIEEGGQTFAVFTFAQRQEPGTYILKNAEGNAVLEYAASNAFQYLILSCPELTEGDYTLWSGDTQFAGASGGMMGGFLEGGTVIERPDWPDPEEGYVEIPPQPTVPVVPQGEAPQMPSGDPPEPPEGMEGQPENMPVPMPPEGMEPGEMPVPSMPGQGGADMPVPDMPEGVQPPQGGGHGFPGGGMISVGERSQIFTIKAGANYFSGVTPVIE